MQNEGINYKSVFGFCEGQVEMRKKASRIFENVKLLAPILLLLFGAIVFFTVVGSVVYSVAGYTAKIPGMVLIALFVMALEVYALWPLISFEE